VLPDVVSEKLDSLPPKPGVYLFKDKKGSVVYVGKAKSLRSRVRSYFQAGGTDAREFIPFLHRAIGDLDTIVTATEKEATILENELIKRHRPRYNVKLRDDKDFLSIRLPVMEGWPRLYLVRRVNAKTSPKGDKPIEPPRGDDGARYFGPYHSATSARRTLHLVNKHFQLRTCSDGEMAARKRPCLQYQIKRCPAPCVYDVDPAWYAEQVDAVAKFLDGRHDELSRELEQKMAQAAREMRFELAAVYRDQLRAIEKVRESQRIVSVDDVDRDVIGLYREGDLVEIALLYVRAGKLADVARFSLKQAEIPDEEIVAAFLAQHYGRAGHDEDDRRVPIPRELIVPAYPEGATGIEEWLGERARHPVDILTPQRGPRVRLLELARENAHHAFTEKRRASDDVEERLKQLQERLRLPTVPHRIECCDISHLGGGDTVGAVVAMTDGVLDKKRYRTFHVKGPSSSVDRAAGGPTDARWDVGGDDYGAMYEVLARRFRRGQQSSESNDEGAEWELPDLFVVDGGRGQLGVAIAAARDLGLHELPIVALAKEHKDALDKTLVDRVYLPGQKNAIPLKSHSASLFFLARVRDEAHRFSNKGRTKLGKARRFKSALDEVKGIGQKTKKALLTHLGSIDAIRDADDAQILAVPGVTSRHLKALRAGLPTKSTPLDSTGILPTKVAPAN
jgi:excinuclease ABC subunit C